MNALKQPNATSCGQTCVAMIVNRTPEEVGKVIGHMKGTFHADLKKALEHFGCVTENYHPYNAGDKLPEIAIVRIGWRRRDRRNPSGFAKTGSTTKWGHAVVWRDGKFYDPATGETCDSFGPGAVITMFAEVLVP